MIELHTLGRIDLFASNGRRLTAVLSQTKRLALLVYLALASPGGYQRRDTLLGLFWPESDEARARAALRQSVRFLRRELGDGVLVGRGDDELGVADAAIACDAVQFRAAIRRGDAGRALGLYRGELLCGVFVAGAPEFERWLEEERERLRREAVAAASTLAASAQADGELNDAERWAQRAVELAPADEAALRRLLQVLDAAANRAAAVEAYRLFAERLRAEYALEPSPETRAIVDGIRAREAARSLASLTLRSSAPNPRRVFVDIFENRTGDTALEPVGRMAADWIAQGLARLGGIDVVPLMAAVTSSGYAGQVVGDTQSLARVRTLADETGAGTIVTGAYYLDGDSVVCSASITDPLRMTVVRSLSPVAAPRQSPFAAIERLQELTVTEIAVLLDTRVAHLRAARPPGYTAYREYVQALDFFIAGAWREALDHLERAADADPSYILPRIVSAIAHWNLGDLRQAATLARRVSRVRSALTPFENAVLEMVLAWLRGDWAAAHAAASRQAQLAPHSIPHFQIAEEARRLNRPAESLAILTQLNPDRGELRGFFFYWLELTQVLHLLARHREELDAAFRARERYPYHPGAALLELRALAALGRVPDVERLVNEIGALPAQRGPRPGAVMREAALELRAHGQPEPAQRLFERSVEWYLSLPVREQRAAAHRRELARSFYGAGRLTDARRLLEELVRRPPKRRPPSAIHHDHLQGYLDLGLLGAIAARRREHAAVKRIAGRLSRMDGRRLFGTNTYWLAAMAGVQGHAGEAAQLLRRAFSEGLPVELHIHVETSLERVRGSAAVQAVLATT